MTSPRPPVNPTQARFIRLGPGSRWAKAAIDTGTIRFGVPSEPHDLSLKGDWDGVEAALSHSGKRMQTIRRLKRQLSDFYTLGSDCLWIAPADGRLWWGFAEPEVSDLRGTGDDLGVVARRIRGGWSCRSVSGKELFIKEPGLELYGHSFSGGALQPAQVR